MKQSFHSDKQPSVHIIVFLTIDNHVKILHVMKHLVCEFPAIFLQCFINFFLKSSLYLKMNCKLMGSKAQKSGGCVKSGEEEEQHLSYDVFIFKF